MTKSSILVLIVALMTVSVCFAEPAEKKLIPVRPSYQEAAYVPQKAEAEDDLPTPRDQMYVFWILGKVLSYPIDKAEEYVDSFIRNRRIKAVPASSPAQATGSNPFSSANWKEIPPAPPATGRR